MANEVAGNLIVSEDVLADVAGHAALQCYGVVGIGCDRAQPRRCQQGSCPLCQPDRQLVR